MTITVSYHLLNQDGCTFRISWKIIDNVKSCYSGNGWIVCAFPRYTNKQSVYLEVLQLLVQFKCATPPLPQDVPQFSVLTIFLIYGFSCLHVLQYGYIEVSDLKGSYLYTYLLNLNLIRSIYAKSIYSPWGNDEVMYT